MRSRHATMAALVSMLAESEPIVLKPGTCPSEPFPVAIREKDGNSYQKKQRSRKGKRKAWRRK